MYLIKKPKTLKHKLHAVSPVVATLVLIVVAIVGAIAVGLIMSRVATDTGNQANVGNVANGAQTQLTIGGSTTLYPLDQAAIPTFEAQYHVNVQDAQGGSDAGMQGVISGALNIGAASSVNAVHNAITDVSNNQIAGVTINYALIGGSGVIVGTTSTGTGQTGVIAGALLTDNTPTACQQITRDALAKMYQQGTFSIAATGCAGNVLKAAGVLPAAAYVAATNTGPYQTVSRSDAGGTEDAFGAYITGDQGLTYVGGSGVLGGSSNTGSGNAGVLSVTQKCSFTIATVPAVGCVGFFDLGFAEGAVAGATCQSGWTASTPCGVAIPELSSPSDASTADVINPASSTPQNQFILETQTTAGLHAFIKSALKAESSVNPATLTGATSVYPDTTAPTNSLARTFYLVTNGTPTPVEEQFIGFMTSYNAEPYFAAQGFFSQYDFTAA